ncbi:MAG: biopolymer transporter ExbD [Planctomycetes bacterium]|nr:biopolymer transporter ExbD [Planctomycetota bacterium]
MSKKTEIEDVSMDMTSMIDVVFLLIIFFILMPPKEMEGKLESYLPATGQSDPNDKPDEPPVTFSLQLEARSSGDKEIITEVRFNNSPVCEFTTLTIKELNKIYKAANKTELLKAEHDRDAKQFDPAQSQGIRRLIGRMTDAAANAPDGKDTDIMIDASSNVPFKLVLAMLNAGAGAEFPNLKFTAPTMSIWKPD